MTTFKKAPEIWRIPSNALDEIKLRLVCKPGQQVSGSFYWPYHQLGKKLTKPAKAMKSLVEAGLFFSKKNNSGSGKYKS